MQSRLLLGHVESYYLNKYREESLEAADGPPVAMAQTRGEDNNHPFCVPAAAKEGFEMVLLSAARRCIARMRLSSLY